VLPITGHRTTVAPQSPKSAASATSSGTQLERVYSQAELDEVAFSPSRDLGDPGAFPFTRGVSEGMYRDELWVMGQYSGTASAENTNKRIKTLLANGQRGFSIALDLPTQLGLDSDDPRTDGEVGIVGVPLDTVEDMITVLDGIELDTVRQIRTTANSIAPIAAGMFSVAAEELGYSPQQFRVMFQNDVLKEYVARGTQIFSPAAGLRFTVDLIEHCARKLPHWEPIEFCGYHYRDSGSTVVQEVAFALANALEYLGEACSRGLDIDDLGHSFFMFLSGGLEIFEEAAKFRAARRTWARLMEERFKPKTPDPCRLNIFCYTLGSPQTLQEPLNNIVRIAYQTLAAVLGGAQVIATTAYDEAFQLPSDEAVRIALRTQQIAAYETDAARTVDPLGGSYFVESLTVALEREIRAYLAEIESRGGALSALESGWIGSELENAAYAHQRRIEDGEHVVVGVNAFRNSGGSSPALQHRHVVDAQVRAEQIDRLEEVRKRRSPRSVETSLAAVRDAARHGANTVEPIAGALRARASIGEIVGGLKEEWGTSARR
jgi:methylmalonyl-CoA mutase N-terminal domain/subunit